MRVTAEMLAAIAGRVGVMGRGIARSRPTRLMADLATAINRHAPAYGIDSRMRMAAFLANACHETGGFARLTESLNYSVAGLKTTFGRHRISLAECERYGRKPGRPADQQSIANIVYGGAWGRKNLGNTHPGDGWRFRGSGLMQTTGRANFQAVANAGLPGVMVNPDLLRTPDDGTLAACIFWRSRRLNEPADRGDIDRVRRAINGGTLGMAEVRAALRRALDVLPPDKPADRVLPKSEPSPAPTPEPSPAAKPAGGIGGFLGWLLNLLRKGTPS